MNKKEKIRIILITACVVFVLTTIYYMTPFGKHTVLRLSSKTGAADLSKLTKAEHIIDREFMGEADKEKMVDLALTGFVEALGDDYTSYLSENTYRNMTEAMEGSYHGIGITAGMQGKNIYVKSVTKGSPAEAAKIMVGDILLSVNGKDYNTDTYVDALQAIKSTKDGESVILRLKRGEEIFEKEVFVGEISRGYITEQMLDGGIGYVRVKTFATDITDDFEKAVEALKKENMTSLIIDLRSNPGGSLDAVVEMTDLLMGEGIITTVKTGSGDKEEYKSDKKELDVPMCVLINSQSASASEIMSAALKYYKKATLVGETTFGKGVVQGVYEFGDGSALRLTIAKYFTPSGECIDGVGVVPDIEALMPEGEPILEEKILTEEDVQLHRAKEILLS